MKNLPGFQVPAAVAAAGVWFAAAAPSLPASTLFALVDTGELFASPDGGASWTARAALPVPDAVALLAGSSPSDLVLASRTGTVYRSADHGHSWVAVGAVPAADVVDLAGRTDGALLGLTAAGTVWISVDEGVSFTALAALTAPDLVSLSRGADGVLLAVTATGTVRRSLDGGATWAAVATVPVSDAVEIRSAAGSYFILTDSGFILVGADDGSSWTAVGTVSQVGMRGLAEEDGELVAIERTGLTARSGNGAAWSWVGTVNQLEVRGLANDVPQTVSVPADPALPPRLVLAPPSPNPVRAGGSVLVTFDLAESGEVGMALFDAAGRRVARRDGEQFPAQTSRVAWGLPALPAGVYFLALETGAPDRVARRLVVRP